MKRLTYVGRNINQRRERLGLSLSELAKRSHTSKTYLWDVERGTKEPTVGWALSVARILGCTVSDLVGDAVGDERAAGFTDGALAAWQSIAETAEGNIRNYRELVTKHAAGEEEADTP